MDRFTELWARQGVAVIQDACQAVGACVQERPLGGYGTAVYSFYATKNLTMGEGGMVTSNDPAVAEHCSHLRHQAYAGRPYVHDRIGYNFRLTELAAAIGLAQLRKLPALTERRRAIAAYYDQTIPQDRFPRPGLAPGACHVFHQYTLRLGSANGHDERAAARARDALRQALERAGVGTGVYYPVPVHRQPAYQAFNGTSCPSAERACAEMFSIPIHHSLSDAEVELVAEQVRRL